MKVVKVVRVQICNGLIKIQLGMVDRKECTTNVRGNTLKWLKKVVKEERRECAREVTLSTGTLGILMFADDMAMTVQTKGTLQHDVEAMNEALIRWDLKVNWKK